MKSPPPKKNNNNEKAASWLVLAFAQECKGNGKEIELDANNFLITED